MSTALYCTYHRHRITDTTVVLHFSIDHACHAARSTEFFKERWLPLSVESLPLPLPDTLPARRHEARSPVELERILVR